MPSRVLLSRTACIPMGAFLADVQRVVRKASALRLISLTNTIAKVLATQFDIRLRGFAAHSVATPQRGLIGGRNIGDNLFELEVACLECSCMFRLLLCFFCIFVPPPRASIGSSCSWYSRALEFP